MSTYLYIECRDHDPVLRNHEESGQHLRNLEDIRRWIQDRELYATAYQLNEVEFDDYFLRNTIRFLVDHKNCTLGIRDEYGVEHPLEEPTHG